MPRPDQWPDMPPREDVPGVVGLRPRRSAQAEIDAEENAILNKTGRAAGEFPMNSRAFTAPGGPPAWEVLVNVLAFAASFIPVAGGAVDVGVATLDAAMATAGAADVSSEATAADEAAAEADAEESANSEADSTCTPNSFSGNTTVLMADGSSKPIDRLKIGDQVENAAPDGLFPQRHTVTAVHVTDTDRAFDNLTKTSPSGTATITSTAYHLFWDVTTQKWTAADELQIGDELQTPTGRAHVAASHQYTAAIRTYNLTIDTVRTYPVVAGNTPALVHNTACGDIEMGRRLALARL
jgi:hypothetical protein